MRELRVEIKTQLINNVKAVWDIEEWERSRERKTWKNSAGKDDRNVPNIQTIRNRQDCATRILSMKMSLEFSKGNFP